MKPTKLSCFYRFAGVVLSVLIGASFLVLPPPSFAAENVGKVYKQRADAYGTPPGETRERKFPRYSVVHGELIETSGGAAILIKMIDNTELLLGERASMVIDEFVYDPDSGRMQAVYNFALGTLRFVSGKMAGEGVSIITPSAAIGLRGSEAVIFVTPDGETIVNVFDGTFSVRSRDYSDEPAIDVAPNQNVSVARGAPVSAIAKGVQLPDYTHAPDAKVPDFSDDFVDLTDDGAFYKAPAGKVTGSAGAGDGHDDEGGHHDAAD